MELFQTSLVFLTLLACLYLIFLVKQESKETKHRRIKKVTHLVSPESISQLPTINDKTESTRRVPRICITGGPCAGKTSSLAKCSFRLPELGWRVFTVPEAATLLEQGGVSINNSNQNLTQRLNFQIRLLKLQISLENIFTRLAENCGENAIVLCDRGVMDGAAYIENAYWQALLDEMVLTEIHLRDCRYDAVVHLVTAADGAEDHFSRNSNQSRYENLDEAKKVDYRLEEIWTGHPNFYIIDNKRVGSFEEKIEKCLEIVFNTLDLPSKNTTNYKFLVENGEKVPEEYPKTILSVQETFLVSEENCYERVQKRGKNNSFTYLHTKEVILPDGERESKSALISSKEYLKLIIRSKDESRETIFRNLECFIWAGDYMILDKFLNEDLNFTILRISSSRTKEELNLPEFLNIKEDVTKDMQYSTHTLSIKRYQFN